jgi:hypothetical protein
MSKTQNDLSGLFVKVRVSKKLYKYFDSYDRRQKWILKKLLETFTQMKKI